MNTNISGPLISLIVPVYNVKDYLKTCLQSILEQTYKNLEIILVDDGSDDGSSGICDEYARMDQRIKTIHLPHSGVSAARNAGLAAATGELLGFVDSDDWIDHDMYQYLYTLMQEHDAVLLSNHGQVVCGRDFDEVLERALFFEMACRIIVQSRMDYTVLSRKEVEDLRNSLGLARIP